MNLPKLEGIKLQNESVFVRGDLDISIENGIVKEDKRLQCVTQTLEYLLQNGAYHIYLAGHRGRPEGKPDPELSLQPLAAYFKEKLGKDVFFVPYEMDEAFQKGYFADSQIRIYLLENLRFWPGEESCDPEFVQKLSTLFFDAYVNEAFASSHRGHASIIGVPWEVKKREGFKVLAGLQFAKEVDQLSALLQNPRRPLVSILSGVKKDKLDYLESFKQFSDKVLVAGRLPHYLEEMETPNEEKILVAKLMPDKEDITLNSMDQFIDEIKNAQTVLVAGPIGKYEDEGHRQGTQKVFEAIANSSAYKIAGGGDTEDALRLLGLQDTFDWVSVGGGAMLEFLAKGTLPGIDALQQ